MERAQRRSEGRHRRAGAPWATPRTELGLLILVLLGFSGGLAAIFLRDKYLPSDYEADSRKIESIANGSRPDFVDSSFTPIARIYEALGLGTSPLLAAVLGYVLASVTIMIALYGGGRRTASWSTALYMLGSFIFAGIYLGQYSKDVFLLPLVIVLVLLPRRLWWDLCLLGLMGAAAYLFRDYWLLIMAAYIALRVATLRQLRMRYLLLLASGGALLFGLAIYVGQGRDPNHYRTSVQGYLEASTIIHPFEPLGQPAGGMIDIFVQFWLFFLPLTLPFSAGLSYIAIMAVLSFLRIMPLFAARSQYSWGAANTRDGATARRAISLFIAFAVVQALFEPDYGSVLRHLTPILPLGIVSMQAMSRPATGRARAYGWSWSAR